ncbi:hypothetical protein [Methanobacterium ferruginis]|uniref:hypothetical protein n=1 Tax=Methanobacterium ferruginis TaxID=710191 RepID=UPI002573A9F5|nr:hypothetical protein [Methanobacterium ferruginis]BDZ68617.1 hypothetical protein GCM10025860_20650 [Methanobacterium ferruginis]
MVEKTVLILTVVCLLTLASVSAQSNNTTNNTTDFDVVVSDDTVHVPPTGVDFTYPGLAVLMIAAGFIIAKKRY